jgi:multicomponent Na+:H+ antiporter subunit G
VNDLIAAALLTGGALLMLLAGIGILRMPDVYTRMQASAKASTLGAGMLLLAVTAHFEDLDVTVRTLATIAFIFLTVPVSAHLISRAAYRTGAPVSAITRVERPAERPGGDDD